jgi:hypothetical protein
MGTVLTQRMNHQIAAAGNTVNLRVLAENPNVFLQPAVRDSLPPDVVHAFQGILANSLHSVFLLGTTICFAALVSAWLIPAQRLTSPGTEVSQGAPSRDML